VKIQKLTAAFLILNFHIAWASNCRTLLGWFEHIDPASEEWRAMSVRDPAKPLLDADYPPRLHDAVLHIFKPWYDNLRPESDLVEMLTRQNVRFIKGANGDGIYTGASRREFTGKQDSVAAGILVHEHQPKLRVSYSINLDTVLGNYDDSHFRELRDRVQREGYLIAGFQEPTEPFPDHRLEHGSAVIEVITLPRTDVRMWNEYFTNYVSHFYPAAENFPKMLQAMKDVLLELHDLQTNQPDNQLKAARLIAEFIYLASNGHYFVGANFSNFMGDASYLLSTCGLKTISQGRYDYLAHTKSIEQFESYFLRDLVAGNEFNPQLSSEFKNFVGSAQYMPQMLPSDQRANLPLDLTVHIASVGDFPIRAGELSWTKSRDINSVEGFSVSDKNLPTGLNLQYRASTYDGSESGWVDAGTFVGSRGRSMPLQGISFRLTGPQSSNYNIWYQAYFDDYGFSSPQRNGEDLNRPNSRMLLMRVWLEKKI
jgi:hypothetical protein